MKSIGTVCTPQTWNVKILRALMDIRNALNLLCRRIKTFLCPRAIVEPLQAIKYFAKKKFEDEQPFSNTRLINGIQ